MEQPLHFYSMGSAEGTMSRVVAELGEGRVKTLACSPNIENGQSFLSHGIRQMRLSSLGRCTT